ncbi:hypothetical protein T01_5301 [Trichinella spiralis]|uniref:Uncharacterized protein n=1 Tax=Trichinella spiralis TaxID=6334 RepID=A0A0V1BFI9_TRISP|nr:hypothetical protein T01_7501 [Trichinella spiralis]KRY35592.1 hypothetical protein T01_5301 [Trichinella spiralis]
MSRWHRSSGPTSPEHRRRWRRTSRSILVAGRRGSPFHSAPTSWSGHRRRQRQCFQTRLQHQAKSLTAFPRQRPQDQAACSTQSPVEPGLRGGWGTAYA